MQFENMYAKLKYVWCFEKQIMIEKYLCQLKKFLCLLKNISWFKNTWPFKKKVMRIENINGVCKNVC